MNTIIPRPVRANTCAIIVTYHPDMQFPDRVRKLLPQIDRAVVVDNGSNPESVAMLSHFVRSDGLELIANHDNLGIATALNQGAEWAVRQGYDWILTFDQDSIVDPELVVGLQHVFDNLNPNARPGIIASNFRARHKKSRSDSTFRENFGTGEEKIWKDQTSKEYLWIERDAVITSGTMLAARAFLEAGRFRDDFFIDMVDNEYCLRLRARKYQVFLSARPFMTHAIGATVRYKVLWGGVNATNHSPLRRYYIARNRVALARLYLRAEPVAVLRELRNMLIESVVILICETNRKKKLSAIFSGMADAVRGRMGKKEGLA